MPDGSRLEGALRVLIVAAGIWALSVQACVFGRVGFAVLEAFAPVSLLLAALVLWWMRTRKPRGAAPPPAGAGSRSLPRGFDAARLAAPFAIVALHRVTGSDLVFWALAAGWLSAEVWLAPSVCAAPAAAGERLGRAMRLGLAALCLLSALLTAGALRPDADDAYFVSVASAALDFPHAPLQGFDGMTRDGLPPVEQALHLPEAYELGIALLASISKIPVRVLHYLVLPPLWAIAATLVSFAFLRRLLPGHAALIGTAVWVFLLAFWGDGHRSFGNFGFVRLFQGKSIALMVVLPLIVMSALAYRERPAPASWLLLLLSQCAAVGFTTNALVLAPAAAAIALVARPRRDVTYLRVTAAGLAASLPLALIAALAFARLAPYRAALALDAVLPGSVQVLGSERAPLVLLALVALPALASRAALPRAGWLAGYVWLGVVLLFLPQSASLLAQAAGNVFHWRLFWALPLPPLVSLAAAILAGSAVAHPWLRASALALFLALFALAGPAATAPGIWSWRHLDRFKVEPEPYAAAQRVVEMAPREGRALVPESVAIYVSGTQGAPPLVGVRSLYLAKLRGLVADADLSARLSLLVYAEGGANAPPLAAALAALDRYAVSTFAFAETHRDAAALAIALVERGFRIERTAGFVLAARSRVED